MAKELSPRAHSEQIIEKYGKPEDARVIDGVTYYAADVRLASAIRCKECGWISDGYTGGKYFSFKYETHPKECPNEIEKVGRIEKKGYYDAHLAHANAELAYGFSITYLGPEYLEKLKNRGEMDIEIDKALGDIKSLKCKKTVYNWVYQAISFALVVLALSAFGGNEDLRFGISLVALSGWLPSIMLFASINSERTYKKIQKYGEVKEPYGIGFYENDLRLKCMSAGVRETYYLSALSEKQAEDVVELLKEALANKDTEKVAAILHSAQGLAEGEKEARAARLIELKKEVAQEEIERFESNPLLANLGVPSAKAERELTPKGKILENFSEEERGEIAKLTKELASLSGEESLLSHYDKEKLSNCLGEFRSALSIMESGQGDPQEFLKLVRNCSIILSTIKPKLIEGKLAELSLKNDFLQEKYRDALGLNSLSIEKKA